MADFLADFQNNGLIENNSSVHKKDDIEENVNAEQCSTYVAKSIMTDASTIEETLNVLEASANVIKDLNGLWFQTLVLHKHRRLKI